MKILTVLGTRPEIIRLSLIIDRLDQACEHILVHTGQNYDPNLNDIFFQQMGLRQPDYHLGVRGDSFGEVIGKIISASEQVLLKERPDRLLILGDTNSALSAIVAKRMGIPVYHMEAGNRCYDDRVPEEVNRRIIDHSSDILMPYTERGRQNLLREGIPVQKIFVTGNPINEVIRHYEPDFARSTVLDELKLAPKGYFLVTMHRAENVDVEERLRSLAQALDQLQNIYQVPVIVSTHPHTLQRMKAYGIGLENDQIRLLPPFGFFDFITLERNARCLISDSGTVQEECAIFGIPNVTIRDVTERPETIECGSNILSGVASEDILRCVKLILSQNSTWTAPSEYLSNSVSDTILKICLGYLHR